jgi:hypothetical protein
MSLAGATGGLIAFPEGREDLELEAGISLAGRAGLSLTPLLCALVVLPLTLLLRARSALVPLALGLTAACALVFGPLDIARTLAASEGVPALVYLGPALAVVFGALTGAAARRA